jgi:hypothetical protein
VSCYEFIIFFFKLREIFLKKRITNLSKDQLFFCLRAALEAASVEFKIQLKEGRKKKSKKQSDPQKKGSNWIRKARLKDAK